MTPRPEDLVVFLGPSLTPQEAHAVAPCRVMPPARQGDVWRALVHRPVAIALIDGVFAAQPSVWHREILAAMDAGVTVFGAASMGALRAAELGRYGMIGVGTIHGWYRDRRICDDAEVALLHAGPEFGHRAFTVPLVNVRHAAALARDAGVLRASEAAALVDAAAAVYYQDRTWPVVLDRVAERWRTQTRVRWEEWAAPGIENLKSRDARECLRAAGEFVAAQRGRPRLPRAEHRLAASSLVRRRRLHDVRSKVGPTEIAAVEVLETLQSRDDAAELATAGLRRALLAGWARELGLTAAPEEVAEAEAEILEAAGFGPTRRAQFLAESALDEAELSALAEDVALERAMLEHAPRLLSGGPDWYEGLAAEARISGVWAKTARALAPPRRRPDSRKRR